MVTMRPRGIYVGSGRGYLEIDADDVSYEPETPGNWSPPPEDVGRALDQLAAKGGGGQTYSVVYQPGGVAGGNVYTDFNALYAAAVAIAGGVRVVVDDSITSPAVVPPKTGGGSYALSDWHFEGAPNFNTASGGAALQLADGVSISPQTTIWFSSLDVTFAGSAPCIETPSNTEANIYLYSTSLASTSTGPFAKADTGGFVEVVSNSSLIGDGTHTTLLGNTGGNMFVQAYDGTTIAASATDAAFSGGTQIRHDASSNVHTQPGDVTVAFADDAYRVGYDPGEPTDWVTAPTDVGDALDALAAKNNTNKTNAGGIVTQPTPQTLSATNYTPGTGAKATFVSASFRGTCNGEASAAVSVTLQENGNTIGVPIYCQPDSTGKFGGTISAIDDSGDSPVAYSLVFAGGGGSTFTIAAQAINWAILDLG